MGKTKGTEIQKHSKFKRVFKVLLYITIGIVSFVSGNLVGSYLMDRYSIPTFKELSAKFRKSQNTSTPTPQPSTAAQNLNKSIMINDRKITIPSPDDSDQAKADFAKTIYEAAKESDIMIIESCTSLKPNIIKSISKTKLTITNKDSSSHSMGIAQTGVSVPGGSSEDFDLTKLDGNGIFGIRCDEQSPAAFIWIP